MEDLKVDFQAKFYVRLEDEHERQFTLDLSQLDGPATLDEAPTLLERLQESNRQRLRGDR
jgi:hypothetical protein